MPAALIASPVPAPRKRTMSFSAPQPPPGSCKPSRAAALARSAAYVSLVDMQPKHHAKPGPYSAHRHDTAPLAAYAHIPRQPRERRKSLPRGPASERVLTITPKPRPARAVPAPTPPPPPQPVAARTHFPRAKPEPDLLRIAITTRMRMSPEGQKILHMGPRLAFSIYCATKELEQIVAAQRERERDVDMDVACEQPWACAEDWEMVDCC